jgi:hypothetical protein
MSPNKKAPAAGRTEVGAASARSSRKTSELSVGQDLHAAVVGHVFAGGDRHG